MKTRLFQTVATIVVLVATLAWTTPAVSAETACNPDFVSRNGELIRVMPTGVDDSINIQCAFDMAVATGPEMDVRLTEGTFYISQIVVNDFHGSFSGAGAEKTLLYNVPNMYVTPVDFYLEPPSAANPWPSLFSFIDGEYQIHDLGILITTGTPTTPWTIWGLDPPKTGLMLGIGILGTHADVVIRDIVMKGELDLNNPYWPWEFNLFNGVYMWNWDNAPISGSLLIERSTFSTMAYGTPVANLFDVSANITRNAYIDNFFAMDGYDLEESRLAFTQNKVTFKQNLASPHYGAFFYNIELSEISRSSFLFANNRFEGEIGVDFEPVLGAGNNCLFLANNTLAVSDYPIFLGEGTHDCKVIGGSPKTRVLDLGMDNIMTGVNNMGKGMGPGIHRLLRRE